MPLDRTVDVSNVVLPADFEPDTTDELINKLCFIRDGAIAQIINSLKSGQMKGTSAASELVDRASKLIENAGTAVAGGGSGETIEIHFDDRPYNQTLELFATAIKSNTATGSDIWTPELQADYTSRENKSELLAVFEAARENALLGGKNAD